MLSLWKLRVGAESYYLSHVAAGLDDYYTGRGEMPGRWLGAAISGLSLAGTVTADELRAVLAGLAPGTGLSANGDQLRPYKGRVPGFDLCFSAPKSVSVLYALADPLVRGQIVEALDAAVDTAVGWLEREACFVRRGSNNRAGYRGDPDGFGTRRLRGGGFIAAGFRHRTSRAGDPQLHTHVLIANLTRGPDGRWSALDGQAVYRSRRAAGTVYDSAVRDELTRRLGVEWQLNQRGDGEIAGIPAGLLRQFSKRRQDIDDELERTGASGPVAAAAAALATRTSAEAVDGETLDARWHAEAAEFGWGPDDVDRLLAAASTSADPASGDTVVVRTADPATGVLVEQTIPLDALGELVGDAVVSRDSSVTRHQVLQAVAHVVRTTMTTARLERLCDIVLGSAAFVPLPTDRSGTAGFEQRWTTRRLLDVETELLDAIASPHAAGRLDTATVHAVIDDRWASLGADQAAMVRQVTTQGRAVEVVVGRAGTGKTYAMAAVRDVYQHAGYTLVGVAPSALAARGLGRGGGFEAFTFPRFHRHCADRLTDRHVVVIDEAAMAGTIDLHHTILKAQARGAKVILVGDHHQLPEVTAGGGFSAAVHHAGRDLAELTVNRRQTTEWEIAALDQLRNGDVAAAFAAYQAHGRVVLGDDPEAVHRAAVADWWVEHQAGSHALLLAGTRAEANALNRDARALAAAAGHLSGRELTVGERTFQVGDRIICLRNDGDQYDLDRPGGRCRVDNGTIGTITSVHRRRRWLDVRLTDGRHVRLLDNYLDSIDHGYAVTIHKSQGVTCDDVFVVGPRGLFRQAAYVAMSRARRRARIYATSRDAAALGERQHSTGIRLPSEPVENPEADLLEALERSQAKLLASSLHPHLAAIADTARAHTLDMLWDRHRHIRHITRQLVQAGLTDPTVAAERLTRARTHRQYLATGVRVRALDWDNVGTVTAVIDNTGRCAVHFQADDGRQNLKLLEWADCKPIDHPDRVELTDDADDYFTLAEQALHADLHEWHTALAGHGIGPDEPVIVAAAIDHRRRQVTHHLAGQQPDWLTWWYGPRPTDPAGAQVWDDEIAALAAWRDARNLPDNAAGYGPQPEPAHVGRWRDHLQRSLDTRVWLRRHRPNLDPTPVPQLTAAATRDRLTELAALLADAPPDQSRIIADLESGILTAADLDAALQTARDAQGERAQWILEHWPHVVEHAELTALAAQHGPLDHWPIPLPADAQHLYDQLVATSTDSAETRTLDDLDAADPHHHTARLRREHDNLLRQLRDLDDERRTLATRPDLVAQLEDHRGDLLDRIRPLPDQIRHDDAAATAWRWTTAGREVTAASLRRINHLSHAALAEHQPWTVEVVRRWANAHPGDDTTGHLRRLIDDIAAHRERRGITADDPIGPTPPNDDRAYEQWQRLQQRLDSSTASPLAPTLTL